MTSLLPEPLRIANFRRYWAARLISTLAQLAMVIIIGWQVYDIARETMGIKAAAVRLGLVGVVQFVPLFALSLVAGWAGLGGIDVFVPDAENDSDTRRRTTVGGAYWLQAGRGRLGVVTSLQQEYQTMNSQLLERRLLVQTHIEF